jgi:hypothetical protein
MPYFPVSFHCLTLRLIWLLQHILLDHLPCVYVIVRLFVCSPGVTTHCGCILHSPVTGLSSSFSSFLEQTQRRAAVGRTPLDEWSIRRTALYLTTYNTHNRQTSMHSVEFETRISARERPKTNALDRAATGTGVYLIRIHKFYLALSWNL